MFLFYYIYIFSTIYSYFNLYSILEIILFYIFLNTFNPILLIHTLKKSDYQNIP